MNKPLKNWFLPYRKVASTIQRTIYFSKNLKAKLTEYYHAVMFLVCIFSVYFHIIIIQKSNW